MLEAFKDRIKKQLSFLKNQPIVIAISGGVDSVVLSHLCHYCDLNIALAHCNFKLRGEESDKDQAFVEALAEQLGVEVFIQAFDTKRYMQAQKVSLQMAARELRYQWFQDLVQHLNYSYILTAHHADDNLETFLINFSRGTGLNGLTGIPEINDNVVRPLLRFSRQDILNFARAQGYQWREDQSNHSRKYLRNKLRHDLVPLLKELNPNLLGSFQDTISNLNDTADIVEESLNAVAKRAITVCNEHEVHYKVSEFKKVNNPRAYLHEMFKAFGFTEWDDVLQLLDAESGKMLLSPTHRLIKHREVLILTDIEVPEFESFEISEEDTNVEFPQGSLSLILSTKLDHGTKEKLYLDRSVLQFPLHLRIWQTGDVFQPSGMTGKKKVSKFLKDEAFTPTEKERTWVLCSGNDIVWIVGKRADERFLASASTTDVLSIECHPTTI